MLTSWRLIKKDRRHIHFYGQISQDTYIRVATVRETLQWPHNGRDSVSNHQPRECLLSCLIRRRSKKTSKLRVTGLCEGNSPGTGEFPSQKASNAENVSIWWRHHESQGSSSLSQSQGILLQVSLFCNLLSKPGKSREISSVVPVDAHFSLFGEWYLN